MKFRIENLKNQNIPIKEDWSMRFNEISCTIDSMTGFEFDDRFPHLITFRHEDSHGKYLTCSFDLSKYNLTYRYILDKIRPYFENEK